MLQCAGEKNKTIIIIDFESLINVHKNTTEGFTSGKSSKVFDDFSASINSMAFFYYP